MIQGVNIMEQIAAVLPIEFFILLTPLVFIFVDLWSGIRKARIRHEKITSRGFRDTVRKIARYYNVLFVLSALDAMQVTFLWYMNVTQEWDWILFPWLTLVGSIGVGLIEVKSVLEPANDKESKQMKEVLALAKVIVEHRTEPEEIASAVVEYLDKENNEND